MSRKKNREYRDYVEDIYRDLQFVKEFTKGMSFIDFVADFKTQYAVYKALENMGEASKRIPEFLRRKFPDIPFRQMAGLRDIVTHDYDGISYDMIWEVVVKELPPLEDNILRMLSEEW